MRLVVTQDTLVNEPRFYTAPFNKVGEVMTESRISCGCSFSAYVCRFRCKSERDVHMADCYLYTVGICKQKIETNSGLKIWQNERVQTREYLD